MRFLCAVAELLVTICGITPARADSLNEIAHQLESGFRQRILSLKVPLEGDKLRFHADGQSVAKPDSCPWTICGVITADKVRLNSSLLRISGQRVIMVYTREKKLAPFIVSEPVEVQIELPAPPANESDVLATIAKVFEKDVIASRCANYWQSDYDFTAGLPPLKDRLEGKPMGTLLPNRPVYGMTSAVFTGPEVIKSNARSDAFTTQAFKQKIKGIERLLILINETGFPELLTITKSVDPSLDVYAIDDVARWRFRPASKDGKPVAVFVSVELGTGYPPSSAPDF